MENTILVLSLSQQVVMLVPLVTIIRDKIGPIFASFFWGGGGLGISTSNLQTFRLCNGLQTPALLSYWLVHKGASPLICSQNHTQIPQQSPESTHPTLWTLCPRTYAAMWCSRMALRRLQKIAVTPLNITGGLTSNIQREMSTLRRVYVTRQIPPEGLKILRKSGQWVFFLYPVMSLKITNFLAFLCNYAMCAAGDLTVITLSSLNVWSEVHHLLWTNMTANVCLKVSSNKAHSLKGIPWERELHKCFTAP